MNRVFRSAPNTTTVKKENTKKKAKKLKDEIIY